MAYQAPLEKILVTLQHSVGWDACLPDETDSSLCEAIIEQAARFAQEQLAPLNASGDRQGSSLQDGQVVVPKGFAQAYQAFCDAGWPSLTADLQWGGQGMPNVLACVLNEIWHSANLSFALCPMLSQSGILALQTYASQTLQARYLPALVAGTATATMNLTEPQAGSDLASIRCRATPQPDGSYHLQGQKIYITWGDHPMSDNILHLVLARLPDAPAGVRGISMFVVPKILEDGQANGIRVLSLEHKLGIHASPTCVLSYGDEVPAQGYLIGEPNQGLNAMFCMMNHARQGVGVQGLAVAEAAYQAAVAYAKERVQGVTPQGRPARIIEHADVRRMLAQMQAGIAGMRALAYQAAYCADLAEQNEVCKARLELFTPIVKGWLTELAQEMTGLAVQVHGGMGFIEETGVAQYLRDARILTIYEGTTGIQAQDLIGRKILRDRGTALSALFDEIAATASKLTDQRQSQALQRGLADARKASDWLLEKAPQDAYATGSAGVPLLMLLGYLCGAWLLARAALSQSDEAGQHVFTVYFEHLLPRTNALAEQVCAGSQTLMAIPEANF